MAIVFDAASVGTEISAGTTITFAHTTAAGSNRFLYVGVAWNGAVTVSSVTYNGVGLTSQTAIDAPYGGGHAQLWYLVAPATGANNVVVTFSAAPTFANAGCATYTGVDPNTPTSGATGDGAHDTSPATVDVTSAAGDLVVDCLYETSAPTVGGGQTERFNHIDTSMYIAGSQEDGAATVTMSWTFGGTFPAALAAMNVKAVTAAAVPATHLTELLRPFNMASVRR